MKKRIAYIVITLFTLVCLGVVVVWKSVVHVQLPHGAVLHVLPALGISPARGAVVICPGGGYRYLEKWKEGYWWFPFFYTHGYAVAWLEYRMPDGHCQNPSIDGSEAFRLEDIWRQLCWWQTAMQFDQTLASFSIRLYP